MNYRINRNFNINVGFNVSYQHIADAISLTNNILADLPSTLFRSIDYKTTSAMIGSIFCDTLATITNSIVNPIEKGHPDIIPAVGANSSEEILRNYPEGLEVKCTVGNIQQGANLRAGQERIGVITAITWQAHHREVESLMGIVWDFISDGREFNSPAISGIFYSNDLTEEDWGEISGTTGRNTKVTGMRASGKRKMGEGWIAVVDAPEYIQKYSAYLSFNIEA